MVYGDLTAEVPQGGVVPVPGDFQIPTVKGDVNPRDGQLYMAGFQIYGSRATALKGITRLRYTGGPSALPVDMEAGTQGVVLRFNYPLDQKSALQTGNFTVKRWNYERTESYGSGHFTMDGSAGEEQQPVAAVHLSDDRTAVLLVLPDMQKVQQMEVEYHLRSAEGEVFSNTLYLTVNEVRPLALEQRGFVAVDWEAEIRRVAEQPRGRDETRTVSASATRGKHLYQEIGCVGCHSVDGSVDGKFGPTFKGLFGSVRTFDDGSTATADEEYLRQSILQPGSRRVAGFDEGMPSYEGILSETEVESLILFIKSVSE
jgi:cytochrome c2